MFQKLIAKLIFNFSAGEADSIFRLFVYSFGGKQA